MEMKSEVKTFKVVQMLKLSESLIEVPHLLQIDPNYSFLGA